MNRRVRTYERLFPREISVPRYSDRSVKRRLGVNSSVVHHERDGDVSIIDMTELRSMADILVTNA